MPPIPPTPPRNDPGERCSPRGYTVVRHSTNFRDATELSSGSLSSLQPNELLIKNKYVGVNASDILYTSGQYYEDNRTPPYIAGFEGLGQVEDAGNECHIPVGAWVIYFSNGAYSEYLKVPVHQAHQVPTGDAEYVALATSASAAALALEKFGDLRSGEAVLVTAAAGDIGQFAVQFAKKAGCRVIGTCSNDANQKDFLESIGCDHIIHSDNDMNAALQKECPNGVDVVFECVGKAMFKTAVRNLAPKGRMLVIGQLSAYLERAEDVSVADHLDATLPLDLMSKSASIRGVFLPHHVEELPTYIEKMVNLYSQGHLCVRIDMGARSPVGVFDEFTKVPDAVDFLFSGLSIGKVVVEVNPQPVAQIFHVSPVKMMGFSNSALSS